MHVEISEFFRMATMEFGKHFRAPLKHAYQYPSYALLLHFFFCQPRADFGRSESELSL